MSDTPSLNDLITSGKNAFAELFLSSRKTEYEKFVTEKESEIQASARLKWLTETLETRQSFHTNLLEEVECCKKADFAGSILHGAKNHPGGPSGIRAIAANFTSAFMLKTMGNEVLELSEKEVSDAKTQLEIFKTENGRLLRRLGLI